MVQTKRSQQNEVILGSEKVRKSGSRTYHDGSVMTAGKCQGYSLSLAVNEAQTSLAVAGVQASLITLLPGADPPNIKKLTIILFRRSSLT